MFTIGITKGRWNTLLARCSSSRTTTTRISRCGASCPSSAQQYPRYERVGLRDLCQQIHDTYKKRRRARDDRDVSVAMQPAMKPSDAYAMMTHREIDRVEIDHLEGRATCALLTPYPPGIPLLDSRRAVQPDDRRVPEVRAHVQRTVPRLPHRHPRSGGRRDRRVDCVRVVLIPVLGAAVGTAALAGALTWALAKVVLAFAVVVLAGRWLLRPLFHLVVARRSAEVFTLTVLFVSLLAAWTTHSLGLSMAFGAFLAGMMLGETEFRHQVESAIRPFRDVLLGLFFIGIGMLLDPASIPHVWKWALLGAAALLVIKAVVVVHIVRWAGMDSLTAWRTGLLLAVGGEFGFALLAIALGAGVLDERIGQIALNAVLCSMIVAPFLIRFNHAIATRLVGASSVSTTDSAPRVTREVTPTLNDHVIICGYGRIGQNVGNFLEEESIPFIALDLDPATVKQAHTAGEPVFYGDAGEREMLELVGLRNARLLVVSHADVATSLRVLHQARALRPDIPIMVRTPDEHHADEIRAAGATEVVPETLAAGLMIASQALVLMDVPLTRIVRRVREQHAERYRLLREIFHSSTPLVGDDAHEQHRLQAIVLPEQSAAVGRPLADYLADDVVVTALVRRDERRLSPAADTLLQAGDVVVVFGLPEALRRVEASLLRPSP
jgi:monovalent cation:H+ antiporter-2, CPA2 family